MTNDWLFQAGVLLMPLLVVPDEKDHKLNQWKSSSSIDYKLP